MIDFLKDMHAQLDTMVSRYVRYNEEQKKTVDAIVYEFIDNSTDNEEHRLGLKHYYKRRKDETGTD